MTDDKPGPGDAAGTEHVPEHIAVYLRLRSVFGDASKRSPDARKRAKRSKDVTSAPFGAGRDPRGIDDVLDNLTSRLGWTSSLARAELLDSWAELAGEETAEHSVPVGV